MTILSIYPLTSYISVIKDPLSCTSMIVLIGLVPIKVTWDSITNSTAACNSTLVWIAVWKLCWVINTWEITGATPTSVIEISWWSMIVTYEVVVLTITVSWKAVPFLHLAWTVCSTQVVN